MTRTTPTTRRSHLRILRASAVNSAPRAAREKPKTAEQFNRSESGITISWQQVAATFGAFLPELSQNPLQFRVFSALAMVPSRFVTLDQTGAPAPAENRISIALHQRPETFGNHAIKTPQNLKPNT